MKANTGDSFQMKGSDFWDNRYESDSYVFGTEPNDFLRACAERIPKGRVLCLAEGEGRNSVFLAGRDLHVQAVDQSATGLEKAKRLAAQRRVEIETVVADLSLFPIEPVTWSGIVSIFFHLPSSLRKQLHRRVVAGLLPGGVFILEAYTPRQLAFDTGGPKDLDCLVSLASLQDELKGLNFHIAREIERPVIEGTGHTGLAAVVQILAVKD